ncbi:MAG: pyridoxal phosphate-dependent aminotransferase [Thermoplasmata archaeon]
MRFPLADWIDTHTDCRYNFGSSGMYGVARPPSPTPAELRSASEPELRRGLGALLGVAPSRVFLTHGATEANAWALLYLGRGRKGRCRVQYPEYPPLVEVARRAGFRISTGPGACALAVVSRPRNPVGDLWSPDRLDAWSRGARAILVDETFREFTAAPSAQRLARRGLWSTGSFTKAYGADDVRVGFVVPPEEATERFARFHGLVSDEMPTYSVASALALLSRRERYLASVRAIFGRNRDAWRRANPGAPDLAAPVAFDDPVPRGGDRFARRCLLASVLVSPGSFFGRSSGVRVGLTRRSFPVDLTQYIRVRSAAH